jgi:hypothetical protein
MTAKDPVIVKRKYLKPMPRHRILAVTGASSQNTYFGNLIGMQTG